MNFPKTAFHLRIAVANTCLDDHRSHTCSHSIHAAGRNADVSTQGVWAFRYSELTRWFFKPSMLSHFYLPLRSMAVWIVFQLEYAGLHVCSQRVATSMKGVESLKAFAIYETFPY